MKENGETTTWKVLVFMFGTMEENMRVSIKMIKNMVLVFILGQMVDAMRAIGTKENSMA
jgi:hypothetical protein